MAVQQLESEEQATGAEFKLACPMPIGRHEQIMLAHGGGGRLTQQLIEQVFMPAFSCAGLGQRHDGAALEVGGARLAFSTDSYVVTPLFFPGGDIGKLAVTGTVNDLAMCGARPLYLSAGFIIEEGLPIETLQRVVRSMRQVAAEAGVQLVTGDTKVVDRGRGDGLYITTAGIGLIESPLAVAPASVRPGDIILLSGDVGRHGIAVLATREGLEFESAIESDCAVLSGVVLDLLAAGIEVHCLRDLTRGGLASALIEIAGAAGLHIDVAERAIPVRGDVGAACEMLGLDPLYVANEGRMIAIVAPADAERALEIMRGHEASAGATAIGRVLSDPAGLVTMTSTIGVSRVVDLLSGEQLPRIC